jgi:hypothetical protein
MPQRSLPVSALVPAGVYQQVLAHYASARATTPLSADIRRVLDAVVGAIESDPRQLLSIEAIARGEALVNAPQLEDAGKTRMTINIHSDLAGRVDALNTPKLMSVLMRAALFVLYERHASPFASRQAAS